MAPLRRLESNRPIVIGSGHYFQACHCSGVAVLRSLVMCLSVAVATQQIAFVEFGHDLSVETRLATTTADLEVLLARIPVVELESPQTAAVATALTATSEVTDARALEILACRTGIGRCAGLASTFTLGELLPRQFVCAPSTHLGRLVRFEVSAVAGAERRANEAIAPCMQLPANPIDDDGWRYLPVAELAEPRLGDRGRQPSKEVTRWY